MNKIFALITFAAVLTFLGCDAEPHKSDAELGLNATQAAGRRVYDQWCAECHFAYISRGLKGPSMKGLFKKQYMTSGIPANNERVREIIVYGRAKMPGYGNKLTQQQIDQLMEYLHTL